MVEQLSVFLENKAGRLAEMAVILGQAGHNMRALMVADTAEYGVARILVDRPHAAQVLLQEAGYGVALTQVVAVEVPDTPGGLGGILTALGVAEVNIEYAYVFVRPRGDAAVDIFRIEDVDVGARALRDAGFELVPAEALYTID